MCVSVTYPYHYEKIIRKINVYFNDLSTDLSVMWLATQMCFLNAEAVDLFMKETKRISICTKLKNISF